MIRIREERGGEMRKEGRGGKERRVEWRGEEERRWERRGEQEGERRGEERLMKWKTSVFNHKHLHFPRD